MFVEAQVVGDDMKMLSRIEAIKVLEEVEKRGMVVPVDTSGFANLNLTHLTGE
jgi:hypothetical protein